MKLPAPLESVTALSASAVLWRVRHVRGSLALVTDGHMGGSLGSSGGHPCGARGGRRWPALAVRSRDSDPIRLDADAGMLHDLVDPQGGPGATCDHAA